MEMYVLCMTKKRGVDKFAAFLGAEGTNYPEHVKVMPGVGKPFLIFASLPDGIPSSANLFDAEVPIVNVDPAINEAAIDAMLANPPWHLLVYS